MKIGLAFAAAACLLVLGAPQVLAEDAPVEAACLAGVANPPCGYIVPQINLDFPTKPTCRATSLGGPIDLSKCIPLPAVDGAHVETGTLTFTWDVTQDGIYPIDVQEPIVISFSGTATNPKWMKVDVEPKEVVLDAATFANPANMQVDPATQKAVYLHSVEMRITFTRTGVGDDDGNSTERIERANGATQVFLKAKSSSSGQYYKEAFGVEEFRFNPCANDDALAHVLHLPEGTQGAGFCGAPAGSGSAKESPSPVFAFTGLGLLAFAGLRRRGA